ncbi:MULTISPECIES: 1-deoxy-D-xylulose-5-phosphate synthase [Deefgea]|uniref:1-deoxy-D-xylulose-5-phosphate synthase n=1 Tax=Deefgea chitinilytica TaxID=570276 RepID=A0ABS2CA55_9NEIS|nr:MULTISPECIES: 1-deoxy-D-xylulose-5-phosphate synthase [Deefgea]MBM5571024.1 1-deoxy-D-xylulose-5-phosphate synthase [Deefgea chitinilytica]MBM9888254.1 1-deoxy-D-xylulose-5-phosphate synthase [Deefgea sp. CFH1-16]
MKYPLLDTIQFPADLRQIERKDLPAVAQQLRSYLLDSVSQTGGHFASNLGAVELTVALHYVFDTPHDRLVWDVGHQSYPHKILTGRKDRMGTMRQKGGLAGFPKREESEYDTFGVGHSSTSIGAALGMAEAALIKGEARKAIAVIGDGSMTAGQAIEALFNAGHRDDIDLLVILNDNEMSISPNVGAFNNYLAKLLSGKFYNGIRNASGKVLDAVPPLKELAKKGEESVKGFLTPGTLFEEIGFNYIGPIDGHDMETLVATLSNIKELKGPQFLHVVTKKGNGYKLAVADPVKYHAVTPFNQEAGVCGTKGGKPSFTQVFGEWLCDMAARDEKLVGITPAMREGSGMVRFHAEYPNRYFDVGIAEQHAVTFAGGLACEGLKPVVAIYSTFLQRAYDQLVHDVALQNLDVTFAIDRAGLVGADGPTHAGSFDLSFMRCIPNLAILAPGDENECRQMLYTAYQYNGPAAVRYPRGCGLGAVVQSEMSLLPWGKGEIRRQGDSYNGKKVAILAFGTVLEPALAAAENCHATVANMRFIKPLDTELVRQLAATHDLLVTVEDNAIMGGAGSAVLEALMLADVMKPVLQLGLPDSYVEHGEQKQILADCGLDAAGIMASIQAKLALL